MESFNGIVIEDDQTVDQQVDVKNLQVYGNAVFREDVEADEIEIFGSARFRNFVSCDRLSVYGESVMLGGLLSETLRADGTLNISGKSRSEIAVVEGTLCIQEKLTSSRVIVRTRGRIEASRGIRSGHVTVSGTLISGGSVRCDEFEIVTCERSEIARIYASDAQVKYKPRGDVPGIEAGQYLLSSYYIEAQTAELEYTAVDVLECDSAVIGPGCRVGELSYRDEVEIAPGAAVERLYKI